MIRRVLVVGVGLALLTPVLVACMIELEIEARRPQ